MAYNGWTNYETWNVALWIDNEQPSYRYWRAAAKDAWVVAEAGDGFTREERAALTLAESLKDEITEGAPALAGCYSDLLTAALAAVNWMEIATHIVDEVKE